MPKAVITFPTAGEYRKASARLDQLATPSELISPEPGFGRVGAPALVLAAADAAAFISRHGGEFTTSGRMAYRPAETAVPDEPPRDFDDDIFGTAAVMVATDCIADRNRIRIVAHLTGDLTAAFPYLNAEMPRACYNPRGPTLTFMDGHRMVALYGRRIAVAKADDIVDAWRVLEQVRCRANDTWARRGEIAPCHEMRERPPALEIFKRLPGTNCGRCGEVTCLAFAIGVWGGEVELTRCEPVFASAESAEMKDALVEICTGLGVLEETA